MAGETVLENGLVQINGSVEQVIYSNEDNGYAICDFGTDDGELITIVGTLPYVSEGDTLSVFGRWVHNPKYGRQFKVEQYEKKLPADGNRHVFFFSTNAKSTIFFLEGGIAFSKGF